MTKFENLCNEYRENKRLIEELTAMNEAVKEAIITEMNGAETMTAGAAKATYKTVSSTRLNGSALKKDLPDVFSAYSTVSEYKRFTVA